MTAAVVTGRGGSPELEFFTAPGRVAHAGLPDSKSGSLRVGDTVNIRYDANDPSRVVTQANTVARDITASRGHRNSEAVPSLSPAAPLESGQLSEQHPCGPTTYPRISPCSAPWTGVTLGRLV